MSAQGLLADTQVPDQSKAGSRMLQDMRVHSMVQDRRRTGDSGYHMQAELYAAQVEQLSPHRYLRYNGPVSNSSFEEPAAYWQAFLHAYDTME
jgi:hypothetical protein